MITFQKSLVLLFFLLLFNKGTAQEPGIRNFLLLGTTVAEDISEQYLRPVSRGILYGLSSGWYQNAKSAGPWKLKISLVANGSLVPGDVRSFDLDISGIENLEVLGGESEVSIPTILGSSDSEVTFLATVNGETFTFDAPTGIGLLQLDLLPSSFLQAGIGLGYQTELKVRYLPKIQIDEGALGVMGVGLKYQLNGEKGLWKTAPLDLALMGGYTRLNAEYDLPQNEVVRGTNQYIDGAMNAWLFELLASTRNEHWNLFGGTGYVFGDSQYELVGTYLIDLEQETLEFVNPVSVEENVSGWRLTLGGSYTLGWFSTHASYTFQGFNNLSLGFNFQIF